MIQNDYDEIPVFYCQNCLSLKIRNVASIDNSEYCDECGSTNIKTTKIQEWEELYKARYGYKFLENKY